MYIYVCRYVYTHCIEWEPRSQILQTLTRVTLVNMSASVSNITHMLKSVKNKAPLNSEIAEKAAIFVERF